VNPDIRGDDRAASMPITRIADIGAFTSVPLHFSDGRLYGTHNYRGKEGLPAALHRPYRAG
jgi:hypothetical protein